MGVTIRLHDTALPLDGFLVDGFENLGYHLFRQTQIGSGGHMVGKDFLPAVHLHHGDVVLLLVFANLRADVHAAGQQLQQLGVDVVDLAA